MRKFLIQIILFSSPILLLLVSMEYFLREIPNNYSYKNSYLDKNASKIEVLFLGSSHIYYGVNPMFTKSKSFNAAYISQSLNYDLAILKKYQNSWNKLKYIIVPIDYFSLYTTLDTGTENWRVKNYTIYYDINQTDDYLTHFEILNTDFGDNLTRIKNYTFKNISDLNSNVLGWGTTYNSTINVNLIKTGKTAAKRHTFEMKNNLCFPKNIETINSLIEFAEKRDVKIIFITCPAYKTYVNDLEPNQLNNTIKTINQLTLKNSNCQYYNLLTDKLFIESDFFDADHLNELGAKKLTLKIDSIINKDKELKNRVNISFYQRNKKQQL